VLAKVTSMSLRLMSKPLTEVLAKVTSMSPRSMTEPFLKCW
jgi:hypothetical protein